MKWAIVAAVAAALVVVAFASTYTLDERYQAIITQFGEPKGGPVTKPGLHFKLPFVQKVQRFDKRWLPWDGEAIEMPTREKTLIWVDVYARWRIAEPLKFFTSVRNERSALSRLDDILDSETRNVIASHDLIEVVRSTNRAFDKAVQAEEETIERDLPDVQVGRAKLVDMILQKAAEVVPDYGIELVDVQLQGVNYTRSVKEKVFERMTSERKRIAERYRSQGEGKRAEILGKKEAELKRIESEAYLKTQKIKGSADAKATAIYAQAYNLDPSFYQFIKSLESYQRTVDEGTWIFLSSESDYLKPLMRPSKR